MDRRIPDRVRGTKTGRLGQAPGQAARRHSAGARLVHLAASHVWFVSEQPPARRVVRPGAGQRALARPGHARPQLGHARQATRARDAAAVPPRRRQLRAGDELSVFRVGILLGSQAGSRRRRRAAAGEPRENRCAAWAGGPVLPRGAGAIRSVGLRRLGRCLRHAVVRGRVAGRGRVVAVDRWQRHRVAVSAPHARTVRSMPEKRRTRY